MNINENLKIRKKTLDKLLSLGGNHDDDDFPVCPRRSSPRGPSDLTH